MAGVVVARVLMVVGTGRCKSGCGVAVPVDAATLGAPGWSRAEARHRHWWRIVQQGTHTGTHCLLRRRMLFALTERCVRVSQVIADVFGVAVWASDRTDSASLGAAARAFHGIIAHTNGASYHRTVGDALSKSLRRVASPSPEAHAVYDAMLPRIATLERAVRKALA